ncbi:MAG: hypothetical protein AAGF73_03455 [Actinomycetota bacterium]
MADPYAPSNGLAIEARLDDVLQRAAFRDRFITAFDRELTAVGAVDTAVISDEALFSYADNTLASNAAAFLRERFDEFAVLVYLRRPDEFLTSLYSTHIKGGGTYELPEFVDRNTYRVRYAAALMPWIDQAPDALEVVAFDRRSLRDGDILSDALARLGIEAVAEQGWVRNESLSATGCEVLRKINLLCKKRGRARPGRLRAIMSRNFAGRPPSIPMRQRQALAEQLNSDHSQLMRIVSDVERPNFYTLEDVAHSTQDPPAELDSDTTDAMARSLLEAVTRLPKQ